MFREDLRIIKSNLNGEFHLVACHGVISPLNLSKDDKDIPPWKMIFYLCCGFTLYTVLVQTFTQSSKCTTLRHWKDQILCIIKTVF